MSTEALILVRVVGQQIEKRLVCGHPIGAALSPFREHLLERAPVDELHAAIVLL